MSSLSSYRHQLLLRFATSTATPSSTSSSNNESKALLAAELARRESIALLYKQITALVKAASPCGATLVEKTCAELLPLWMITFLNTEWRRNEPVSLLSRGDGNEEAATTTMTQHHVRTWISPIVDAGERVVLLRTADNISSSSSSSSSHYRVAAELPPDDDSVVLIKSDDGDGNEANSSSTSSKITVALNSVKLQTPTPFCRDEIIPNVEDEPAARCGSPPVYAKLRFESRIENAESLQRLVREIGRMCTEQRLRVSEEKNNKTKMIATTMVVKCRLVEHEGECGSCCAVCCVASTRSGEQQQHKIQQHEWFISCFHMVKLRIMYLSHHHHHLHHHHNHSHCNNDDEEELQKIRHALLQQQEKQTQQFEKCWRDIVESIILPSLTNTTNENSDDSDDFLCHLAACVQRYRNLDGDFSSSSSSFSEEQQQTVHGNMHAAIHPAFANALPSVTVECFANPFNTSSLRFCSLFKDTDGCFGSLGTCWDFLENFVTSSSSLSSSQQHRTMTVVEANPPFDVGTVRRLSRTLKKTLQTLRQNNNNNNANVLLSCLVVLPTPRTDVKHESKYGPAVAELQSRDFCAHIITLPPTEAPYVRGQQQNSQSCSVAANGSVVADECITIQRSTGLMLLSSAVLPPRQQQNKDDDDKNKQRGEEEEGLLLRRVIEEVKEAAQRWRDASSLRRGTGTGGGGGDGAVRRARN